MCLLVYHIITRLLRLVPLSGVRDRVGELGNALAYSQDRSPNTPPVPGPIL
jgi:hypothetical protein